MFPCQCGAAAARRTHLHPGGLDSNHVPFFEQLRNASTSGDGSSSPKRAKTGMAHLAEIEHYERFLRIRKEVLNHEQLLEAKSASAISVIRSGRQRIKRFGDSVG
ncbi:hypothetical protein L596_022303 [Steinernema carpocapsae]|uniref:Uncharacterized protein n=1 Tax=Steinernema carpocapsae TaxID=34508 RepID=A0A4U5MLD0_STECR|nr:hypothetical protein L596_022303 [Steinernema carpocapsae]